MKDKTTKKQENTPPKRIRIDEDPFFTKVAVLNNKLANIQRSLTKKQFDLERKNAQLEEQRKKLEDLNKLKNEMFGMAAHDLRSPLSSIMAYSQLLLDPDSEFGTLSETQEKFLNDIYRSSQFMLNLVNDMLDLSDIESGSISMDRDWLELYSLLERTVSMHNLMAKRKKITIQLQVPSSTDNSPSSSTADRDDKLFVSADHVKFEQVLNNLLGNAIKFSPTDSQITVTLEEYLPENNSSGKQGWEKGDLLLHIRDQGPGISAENQKKLFKPFSKIVTETSKKEKSTGLGLAITRKIIEAHGWDLQLDSEVGKGSVFTLKIPFRDRFREDDQEASKTYG